MSKQGYALLSYHNTETYFALQLATDLRNVGINVWLDRFNMRPEDDWNATNQSALADCAVLITLLSPNYVGSAYGRAAMLKAHTAGYPIIPVLVRPLSAEQYPVQVDYRRYIAMIGWQADSIYETGMARLIEAVRDTKVVAFTKFVNPEVRYANQLNLRIEAHKATLQYASAPIVTAEGDTDDQSPLSPRPRIEANWGVNAIFLARGVTLEEMSILSDLPRWAIHNPRFVLMGTKGVGKTTTLLRLMSEHVRAYLDNPKYTPVPFWVDLSRWDSDTDLSTFIAQQWILKSDPMPELASGRIAMYVDGIDELGIYSSLKIGKLRDWLNSKQAPQRIIIACDSMTYSLDYGFNLPAVSIEEMSDSRIREQVSVYMGRASHALLEKMGQHPLWKWWARNPLLLRMVMFLARHQPDSALPDNPETLILQLVEILWEREQVLHNPDWVPFAEMLPQLALFAYRLVFHGTPHSLSMEQALKYLPNEGLFHALISAQILQIHNKRVQFWHRSVLDTLTAVHLQHETIHAHLAYTEFDDAGRRIAHHWDHAMIALSGVLDDPEPMLMHVADVDPYLALDCLVSRDVRLELTSTLVERFMHYTLSNDTVAYRATFDLLQKLTFGDTLNFLLAFLRTGEWHTREVTHDFLMRLHYPIAEDLQTGLNQWDGTTNADVSTYFKQIGGEAIVPLLRLLHKADADVRKGALWALGVLADSAAIVGIVECLNDDVGAVRLQAAQVLRDLPDVAAVPAFIERLRDEEWSVRKAATEALTMIGSSSLPELRRMMASPRDDVKRIAMGVMGRVGDASVVPDLLPELRNLNADIRGIAVTALGQIADKSAVSALALCLDDQAVPRWSKVTVSQLAIRALEQIKSEEAMHALTQFFKRTAPKPTSATTAKERIKAVQAPIPYVAAVEEVVPPLMTAVVPPPAQPQIVLAPHIGESDELGDIIRELYTDDWDLRQASAKRLRLFAQSMQRTSNPHVVKRLEHGLYDDDDFVRWATVEALAFIADPIITSALLHMLQDGNWTVRLAVVRALAEIGDPSVVNMLSEGLKDEMALVREVTVEVLGQFRHADAVPALVKALEDPEPFIRRGVVYALGEIGDVSVVPQLIALLEDEDYQMRWVAVESLGKLRDVSSIEPLSALLNETYHLPYEDAQTLGGLVALTLEQIGTRDALEAIVKKQH